jgi:hypothetical protein
MALYGSQMLSLFLLEDGFTNMNHGSFGTVPRMIAEKQFEFVKQAESKPDFWFRNRYFEYLDISRAAVAELVNSKVEDVVLLENASSAINGILRCSLLKK